MDKATSQSEILLGNITQWREGSNLYRDHHLLFGGDHKKKTKGESFQLRNIADIKCCTA